LGLLFGASTTLQSQFCELNCGQRILLLASNFKQMTLYYAPAVFAYSSDDASLITRNSSIDFSVWVSQCLQLLPCTGGPSSITDHLRRRYLHQVGYYTLFIACFHSNAARLKARFPTCGRAGSDEAHFDSQRLPEDIQPLVALGKSSTVSILPAGGANFSVPGKQSTSSRKQDWTNVALGFCRHSVGILFG
jgi:hypothetical protein